MTDGYIIQFTYHIPTGGNLECRRYGETEIRWWIVAPDRCEEITEAEAWAKIGANRANAV